MSGVRPNTINAYYNEYAQRVNLIDLSKICDALNCELSDLMQYVPDKK